MKKRIHNKKISKGIYWAPRILSIIFLLFLAVFSLDVFEGNYGFWGTILALFMHNIPVIVLGIILWISWKHEIVGAVAFILAGLFFIFRYIATAVMNGLEWYYVTWSLIVAGPAFLIGILFLTNWKRRKK
jgi:hypothetical protein